MSAIACSTLARPNAEFAVLERVAVSIETGEVHLPVSRAEVIRTYRQGDDLVVEVADGRLLLVEGYFADDSMADGPVLLTTEGPEGQMAVLELDADGMSAETQPVALGRLEEMFGVGGDSAGETQQASDGFGILGETSGLTTALLAGGAVALAAVALSDDDDDGGGSDPVGAALARINSGDVNLEDWTLFDVEVPAGTAEQEILRENLESVMEEVRGDDPSLSRVQVETIGHEVGRLGAGQRLSTAEVERVVDEVEIAVALDRINGGTATLEDWGRFGVEVAAGATENDRENLLASLTATVERLGDLSEVQAERIGYAVERAATVNVGGGYARVVDVDFDPAQAAGPAARSLDSSPRNHGGTHDDTLNFGVDTDGDGTADQTASFDTQGGYRPVGARFYDGTADDGTYDESHQYHYRDENDLAVRADIDGAGTSDANGTNDRIERDTNGDGRADSVAVSDNDDGTISRMEFFDPNNPDQVAALARINGDTSGTASWEDFRTAGVDVDDLGTPPDAVVRAVLDVLAIAKETGNGDQALSLLQVQGIVSLMHYNYVLRETNLNIDTVNNEIKGVDQTSFAALGDTDEWHYEEWNFDGLANNRVEFSVAKGTSNVFPSQLVPDQIYQLDFSRILGFRQISANLDFDADGDYDVGYVGEYSEDPEGNGNYDLVEAKFMAGGEYNMDSLPSDSLNLRKILDLGALESITLHEDPTTIAISLTSLRAWAGAANGEPGREIKIHGDNSDSIDIDGVQAGADVTRDGETYTPFEFSDSDGTVLVTFLVDTEINLI